MDCIVIGGGVAGLASAEALLQRGHTVTVLERAQCGLESSWAGGGILSPLCPWDYAEAVTRLTNRGAALFPAWADALLRETGIDPEYLVSGMCVLPPFDRAAALGWCAAHHVRVEQGADAAASEALLLPDVAQVRNPRLMRALRRRVELLGARIIEQCSVSEVVAQAGRVQKLATSLGDFSAERYILTAGAWSTQVMGQHALNLDIKPIRGQMLLFKFDQPPFTRILLQKDLYLIPRRDGHVLAGSTLEDTGFDKSTTRAASDYLRQRAEAIFPQLKGMPLVSHWSGLRPGSPDNIPAIGPHPRLENLYINSGHFRYGVTMAAASVEILVNDLTGAPQVLDVTPYRGAWGMP